MHRVQATVLGRQQVQLTWEPPAQPLGRITRYEVYMESSARSRAGSRRGSHSRRASAAATPGPGEAAAGGGGSGELGHLVYEGTATSCDMLGLRSDTDYTFTVRVPVFS